MTGVGTVAVVAGGEQFVLRADRTLWIPGCRMLVVADLHLGKSAVFRRHGLPVPEGDTERDLERLSGAIAAQGAEQLLIAGDFFHAPAAQSQEVLALVRRWRSEHTGLAVRLVVGNHDRGRAMPPADLEFAVSEESHEAGGLRFVHDPGRAGPGAYAVAGHLHPAVRLRGGGRSVPCFWLREAGLVLPGFGTFTGGARVRPGEGERVFAVADGMVVEVPVRLVAGS
jgi:DNA ligase-associated metallophosphoesterase